MEAASLTESVPLFEPDIGAAEQSAVLEVLQSGWIAQGDRVARLESFVADYLDVSNAVALTSGTAALHLAYLLAGVGPGDEVVVPSLTFCATVNAVRYCGATPVFADICGPDDWTLDAEDAARRLTPKTRAIVVMHYAGYPCDVAAFARLCDDTGTVLIEDAAHGLGGSIDGRRLGAYGTVGCFSFYSNKIVTTAEGGMLVTSDASLAERARRLRSHGMTATASDRRDGVMGYGITELGFNYRLDDLRAALGLAQLDRLEASLERRRALVTRYRNRLNEIPGVLFPGHGERGESAHYILPVLLDGAVREAVRRHLAAAGVQTSVHYAPVHRLAHYRNDGASLPRTEAVADRILTLPLYPSMTDDQVEYVCTALAEALAGER